ncbi:MAG TPA: type II secretion system F family protein [Candidatus Hydrogenedentes bacterium]|nr:type II secretion system F family protein [Candidatus Hydrogenedentota bacterium]HOS02105.1 type II secretion system F family protein [Candidatus Hydrogenedentota bacterium]
MASNADEPTGRIKRVRRTSKKSAVQTTAGAMNEAGQASFSALRSKGGLFSPSGVRSRDITAFLRQLIMMLEAGTPLLKSLQTLAERGQTAGVRGLVGDICQFVESGNPLWQAFERHPRYFTPVFVNLIKASEASGTLVTVLRRLVDYREARDLLRKRVQAAMIYPVVLIVVCCAVITLITQVVVPQFEDLFSKLGVQLPAFSRAFIGTAHFFGAWWWLMLAAIVGIIVLYKLWVRNPLARLRADRLKLRLPVVGPVLRNYAVAEFLRSFAMLLRSGLSMMVTLDLVRSSVHNHAMANTIQNVRDSVEQGQGMEAPLRDAPDVMPPIVTDMLVTGEESGSLDEIAERLADTHEQEVDIAIAAMGESLQPIITVIVGILVGLLALALFVPMVDMIEKLNTGAGGI